MKNGETDFDSLVGRIQATSEALRQDALVVINRSVTARAWLTGYYIVEYEQHGADRAKYGENLLKRIEERLGAKGFSVESLKKFRLFYQTYPALCHPVAAYVASRFANGESLITKLPYHVLVELKSKKFNRADAVQLGMYMEYYRKRVMEDGDNPPIGLLLCTEVGKEAAEYIAPYIDERLFISKYQLQLPGKEAFTAFLKKENEGLPQPVVTKKRKAKGSSK